MLYTTDDIKRMLDQTTATLERMDSKIRQIDIHLSIIFKALPWFPPIIAGLVLVVVIAATDTKSEKPHRSRPPIQCEQIKSAE